MTDVIFSKPEVVFDILKTMTSPNLKPEVELSRRSNCDEFKNNGMGFLYNVVVVFSTRDVIDGVCYG